MARCPARNTRLGWTLVLMVVPTLMGSTGRIWAQGEPESYQLVPGTTTEVGGTVAGPEGAFWYTSATQSWRWMGGLPSVPTGIEVDALTLIGDGRRVVSFDATVTVAGITATDEDLLLWEPTLPRHHRWTKNDQETAETASRGTWTLLFDGSEHGLPVTADIDALHVDDPEPPLEWCLLSFASVTTVNGLTFQPGDIVRWEADTGFHVELAASTMSSVPGFNVDAVAMIYPSSIVLSVAEPLADPAVSDAALLWWDDGSSRLRPYGPSELAALSATGVGLQALDVWYAPRLADLSVEPAVVSSAGPVAVSVMLSDFDGDPHGAVLCFSGLGSGFSITADRSCGTPSCDGSTRNGELYNQGSMLVPSGVSSTVECRADDGTGTDAISAAGPSYVSRPGDADGDGDVDASDLARIVGEVHDDNAGGNAIGSVRSGHIIDSWGGTDASANNQIEPADVSAATPYAFGYCRSGVSS